MSERHVISSVILVVRIIAKTTTMLLVQAWTVKILHGIGEYQEMTIQIAIPAPNPFDNLSSNLPRELLSLKPKRYTRKPSIIKTYEP